MNKFAERLNEVMKNQEINKTQLAKRMSTTHQTISRWCKGEREPNFDTLCQICKELDESADYMLGLID